MRTAILLLCLLVATPAVAQRATVLTGEGARPMTPAEEHDLQKQRAAIMMRNAPKPGDSTVHKTECLGQKQGTVVWDHETNGQITC